jgi:hypothetical protein
VYQTGIQDHARTALDKLDSAESAILSFDNGSLSADLTLLGVDLDVLGSAIYAGGATLFAAFTGGLDLSSSADTATSLDPTAVDPSIFADLLSSIGL